jgi:hypothetical protein
MDPAQHIINVFSDLYNAKEKIATHLGRPLACEVRYTTL